MSVIDKIFKWYGRFERPISSASLVLGFVFDALTLKRVDTAWENIWVLGHLIIVGVFIILVHLKEGKKGDESNPHKAHFWYVNILQFFFGGILSTYLVFYFRSADIFVTWPFILILALAFIANESMKRHYVRLSFQISLFFLSIYSFAIFVVPVILHQIGAKVFIFSGFVSLIIMAFFLYILFYVTKEKFSKSRKMIIFSITGVLVLVNLLYFTNLIPPIPLSIKDAGVYHSIQRNSDGNYIALYEDTGFWGHFKFYEEFNGLLSSPIFVYSAVFSPSNLNTTIVHEWEYFNDSEKKWILETRINLPVIGGRDGGFRTYSSRAFLQEGKWRVNVETPQGQLIGRVRFKINRVKNEPQLKTDLK